MKTFKCDCGQETELVEIDGVLCYNEKRHGNGEPANCKCFNCGKVNTELKKEIDAAKAKADAKAEANRKAAYAKALKDAAKVEADAKKAANAQ